MSLPLTTREVQVLICLSRGLTYLATAREMAVSVHTVNAHLVAARSKLGALDSNDAVLRAMHEGFIPDPYGRRNVTNGLARSR